MFESKNTLMQRIRIQNFSLVILLCCSLFLSVKAENFLSVKAENSLESILFSQGQIVYSHSTTGDNLGFIPDDWGDYKIFGDVCYGTGPQITYIDYNVLHNGHVSVRIDPHVAGVDMNDERELDTYGFSVEPGDHLVFKCWIKTDSASEPGNNNNPYYGGARIGMEFSVSGGYFVDGFPGSEYHYDPEYGFVTWGTEEWTFRQWDVIVPDTYYSEGYFGSTFSPRQIVGVFFWMQVLPAEELGSAWFADAEIYINP